MGGGSAGRGVGAVWTGRPQRPWVRGCLAWPDGARRESGGSPVKRMCPSCPILVSECWRRGLILIWGANQGRWALRSERTLRIVCPHPCQTWGPTFADPLPWQWLTISGDRSALRVRLPGLLLSPDPHLYPPVSSTSLCTYEATVLSLCGRSDPTPWVAPRTQSQVPPCPQGTDSHGPAASLQGIRALVCAMVMILRRSLRRGTL